MKALREHRAIALALIAGLVAPILLLLARVALEGFAHVGLHRINAFIAPGSGRVRPRLDFGWLALEAAIAIAIGALMGVLLAAAGAPLARAGRSRPLTLWIAFACALLASMLLIPGSVSLPTRALAMLRQPMIGGVLAGAALGVWLGQRGTHRSA